MFGILGSLKLRLSSGEFTDLFRQHQSNSQFWESRWVGAQTGLTCDCVRRVAKPLCMGRIGYLKDTFTFQFWFSEWQARELMIQPLLAGFFNSMVLNFDISAEFQTFSDEYANEVYSEDFPKAPFWFDLGNYLMVVFPYT